VGWTGRSDGWWPIHALAGGRYADCPDGTIGLRLTSHTITLHTDPLALPALGVELRGTGSVRLARIDANGEVAARSAAGGRLTWRADGERTLQLRLASDDGACVTHLRLLRAD
jgi:hypothetical protein